VSEQKNILEPSSIRISSMNVSVAPHRAQDLPEKSSTRKRWSSNSSGSTRVWGGTA